MNTTIKANTSLLVSALRQALYDKADQQLSQKKRKAEAVQDDRLEQKQ